MYPTEKEKTLDDDRIWGAPIGESKTVSADLRISKSCVSFCLLFWIENDSNQAKIKVFFWCISLSNITYTVSNEK